jgi:hypothetical protein
MDFACWPMWTRVGFFLVFFLILSFNILVARNWALSFFFHFTFYGVITFSFSFFFVINQDSSTFDLFKTSFLFYFYHSSLDWLEIGLYVFCFFLSIRLSQFYIHDSEVSGLTWFNSDFFFLVSPLNIELFDNWNSWLYSMCFRQGYSSVTTKLYIWRTNTDGLGSGVFKLFCCQFFFHFIYHFRSFFIRVIKLVELIKPNRVNNSSLRFVFVFLWILALC